jgi:hypothetical protein
MAWLDYFKDVASQLAMLISGTEEDGTPIPGRPLVANTEVSGSIDALAETVEVTLPGGCGSVGLGITGTWVGQLNFEGSVDGTTYVPIEASNGAATVNATSGNDLFILPGAGYKKVQVIAAAWTSGTAVVTLVASVGTAASILTGALPAGENHIGQVGGSSVVKDLTLSLDTSAYADGDVLAEIQELDGALRANGAGGVIQSLVVCDKDDQGEALDIVFMKLTGSLGTENAAVSISDADAAKILGIVEVGAGDYVDLVGSQVATMANLSIVVEPGTTADSLFVGAISRGAGTYTAAGISLKIGILQD